MIKYCCYRRNLKYGRGDTKRMEHKGGRIKDHISREKHPGQDDWMDVEWLDEEDKGMMTEGTNGDLVGYICKRDSCRDRDTYGRSKRSGR